MTCTSSLSRTVTVASAFSHRPGCLEPTKGEEVFQQRAWVRLPPGVGLNRLIALLFTVGLVALLFTVGRAELSSPRMQGLDFSHADSVCWS